jgi:PAS domain-containing protein
MQSRNPRYAIELTCKEAYPASLRGTNPKRNSSSESESSSTFSIVVGNQNNYVEVSDGFCKLLGYSRADLLQMKLEDLAAPGTAGYHHQLQPLQTRPDATMVCGS